MAVEWKGRLDPGELVKFVADFASANLETGQEPVLNNGEVIDEIISVSATPEAAALGLTIDASAEREPALISVDSEGNESVGATSIRIWLSVDPAFQSDPAFDGDGLPLGIVCTVWIAGAPRARRERTFNARVAQL